ncbi:hypothetical protein DC498_16000 [Terrimonas sp.]|uniref:hypothetical protein n=1 Tax=Terrimonas sp. TaxID=1914338 RepID=UPI000D522386|nr:hypothetical protein [Terrimonas sp.]PVD51154.1 hypothetical protein DC498_16000 [Terrimonas sp.]
MRRLFLLVLLQSFFTIYVTAQVSEGEIEFNKIKRTVKTIEVGQEPDIVEQAVKAKMLKHGYKPTESKGWLIFKNVNDPEFSDEVCDLHVKVERKSRKEKESSIVYFFASKPNDHATPTALAGGMLVAEGFHGHITSQANAEKLERDIKAQEEAVKKSEKKYDDLIKDQASLEKKIKNLQDELEQNKQKQQTQTQDVENQRKVLTELKAKRNS